MGALRVSAKILVVDDELDLETLLVQKFRREIRDNAMSFVFARDGVEALDTLRDHTDIELVLCDINMPRMDGLTLLARIQETDDPVATVIVSAYGDMTNIRTAMNRGAFLGSVLHRKCAAPIRILMVPNGCSTVSRLVRIPPDSCRAAPVRFQERHIPSPASINSGASKGSLLR